MNLITIKQGKEKNLLRHHPWVFSGALDKTVCEEIPGVCRVETWEGKFIAWGYYDPESHIELRLLSWEENVFPNENWFEETVRKAVLRRKSFFDNPNGTNVFRLIHGEADMLAGIACDLYSRVIRIIISSRYAFVMRHILVSTLEKMLKPNLIILNTDSSFCGIEHLKEVTEYYRQGEIFTPSESLDKITVREDGLYYSLVPGSGQKSGFFCDQRENRIRAEQYVKNRKVLDMCCYTGSFTLHSLRGGAQYVDAFDSSADAVHALMANVNLNIELGIFEERIKNRLTAQKGDMFETLRSIPKNKYDMIILDPPKLAKTSKGLEEAKKGYKDLNRMAMEKIADGGILVTCSCSGALTREDFRTVLAWSAKDAGCEVQVLETLGQAKDHPVRLSFPESEYLKVFILRIIK